MKKVSINTAVFLNQLENGRSQSECLKQLIGKPIAAIEVRGEFFQEDHRDLELATIQRLCKENDWQFYYSIPEALFTEGRLNENIFDYLVMANEFQIQGLKISLGDCQNTPASSLAKLQKALRAYSGVVTVENQPNQDGQLELFKDNLIKLLALVPELGYTFDSGNWYWIKEDPKSAFDSLKKWITVFHLKDIADLTTVRLGEGATNWQSMVQALNSEVPVFLEYGVATDEELDEEIQKVNLILWKGLQLTGNSL